MFICTARNFFYLFSFSFFFCATKSSLLGDKLFLKLAGLGLSRGRAGHPVQYIISLITQKICKSIQNVAQRVVASRDQIRSAHHDDTMINPSNCSRLSSLYIPQINYIIAQFYYGHYGTFATFISNVLFCFLNQNQIKAQTRMFFVDSVQVKVSLASNSNKRLGKCFQGDGRRKITWHILRLQRKTGKYLGYCFLLIYVNQIIIWK